MSAFHLRNLAIRSSEVPSERGNDVEPPNGEACHDTRERPKEAHPKPEAPNCLRPVGPKGFVLLVLSWRVPVSTLFLSRDS